jgi:hypothetical protein
MIASVRVVRGRWPSVRHRAERAVLRTAAHRLNRSEHVAAFRQQLPPGAHELLALDASAFVDATRTTIGVIGQHAGPDDLAISFDDGVSPTALEDFVR